MIDHFLIVSEQVWLSVLLCYIHIHKQARKTGSILKQQTTHLIRLHPEDITFYSLRQCYSELDTFFLDDGSCLRMRHLASFSSLLKQCNSQCCFLNSDLNWMATKTSLSDGVLCSHHSWSEREMINTRDFCRDIWQRNECGLFPLKTKARWQWMFGFFIFVHCVQGSTLTFPSASAMFCV